jgi:hypothetical protein
MPFLKAGSEFLINATMVASQSQSRVAALADGPFVVTSMDNSTSGGDTSGEAGLRTNLTSPS